MERVELRRSSERIALAHHQKPRRIIDELQNPLGEDIYPYAWPVTYAFFKAAIAEGAHLEVPKLLRHFPDAEQRWAKKLNMAGIYYGSKAVEEDIGVMYGYSQNSNSDNPNRREGPRKQIDTCIDLLWGNCSDQVKRQFPLETIPRDKPLSELSRLRMSRVINVGQIDPERWNIFLSLLREMGEDKPNIGVISNFQLARILESPPDDANVRHTLLCLVSWPFYINNKHFFVPASECLQSANLGISAKRRTTKVAAVLERENVPSIILMNLERDRGRIYNKNRLIILRYDKEKAVSALKASGEFQKSA